MSGPPGSASAPKVDIAKTVERARAAWRAGQADEAEMACGQVLAIWPGHPDASHLMGLMAYDFGNLDLAIAHVRQPWVTMAAEISLQNPTILCAVENRAPRL